MFTRREFVKFIGACALIGAGSLSWDVGVNGGRPREESADEEEPP